MTSDAKTGLLLGLVFIFIIAFIINGLPAFRNNKDNNELTNTIIDSQSKTPGIVKIPRDAIKLTEQREQVNNQAGDEVGPAEDNVRHKRPMPEIPLAVQDRYKVKAPAAPTAVKKKEEAPAEPRKPRLPRTYTVAAGDSLSKIAKRFYGAERGNKMVNVMRIFEVNRKVLKSADEIYEGQEIVIPPLPALQQDIRKVENVLKRPLFEPVESIGRRHIAEKDTKKAAGREYVVRKGDSLWRIATEKLGNGNRYREIVKLNAGILENENTLAIGTRLKIPAR